MVALGGVRFLMGEVPLYGTAPVAALPRRRRSGLEGLSLLLLPLCAALGQLGQDEPASG